MKNYQASIHKLKLMDQEKAHQLEHLTLQILINRQGLQACKKSGIK